jgi:excisionase family DNA binding protein
MTQQATEPQATRLVTVNEVCEQLGIKKTKFYHLVNKGELSVYDLSGSSRKPGPARKGERRRVIRVAQADIDAYLARSRRAA